jgi:hypothetical protein
MGNDKDDIETLFITPYFLNDPLMKYNMNKVEEFLIERFKNSELMDNCKIKIIENQKEFKLDKPPTNFRRYFINENPKLEVNISKEYFNDNTTENLIRESNQENKLTITGENKITVTGDNKAFKKRFSGIEM